MRASEYHTYTFFLVSFNFFVISLANQIIAKCKEDQVEVRLGYLNVKVKEPIKAHASYVYIFQKNYMFLQYLIMV